MFMIQTLILIIIFLTGLAVGSFLNCVIYRLEKDTTFLKGRSRCPKCNHTLNWQDLIPILSFLILRGRCRYCNKKISRHYPLVEFATGILFVLIINNQLLTINLGNLLTTTYWLLMACFLIIIFIYDLKHYIIPDRVIYPAILLSIIWLILSSTFFNLSPKSYLFNSIFSALGAGFFFLAIVFLSKETLMGWGDVKLAFLMGLFLGFPKILVALLLAFLIGAIIGIEEIIVGRKTLKSEIPFAPFLVGGTFLAMFWGENLINWYLNFFQLVL